MIKVSDRQRGNGLLSHLNAATWAYDPQITADYEINYTTSVLFLSLKFHACKPEYIYKRINRLRRSALNVLMVLIDVPNYSLSLRELYNNVPLAMVLCRSNEECSLYLRGFDIAARRSTDVLRRKESGAFSFLGSFPNINTTDSRSIASCVGTVQDLFKLSENELAAIPGIGRIKAAGIAAYLKMPFKRPDTRS